MLDKIVLVLLISLIHSETQILKVTPLETNKEIQIDPTKNGLICVQLYEDLKKDDSFYLVFSSEEKGIKMNKTIYYQPFENSCNDPSQRDIDFDNLKATFKYSESKPNLETEDNGFSYEYEIKKKEDKQKYMLLLFRDFTGKNKLKVVYSPFSVTTILIFVVVIVVVIIFVIIMIIVIICICVRRRRQKQTLPQYQSSYVQEKDPILPDDTAA